MKSRLGGKKLMHPVLQDRKIIELRSRLRELDDEGYFDGVADDDTVSQPSSPASGENAKAIAVPPPPSSSRAAALMAAANMRAGNSEGVLID